MFVIKRKATLASRAREINNMLEELGLSETSQTGREIRGVMALELLGEQHEVIQKYSKATFLKSVDNDDMKRMLVMIREEGLLNKKGVSMIEKK